MSIIAVFRQNLEWSTLQEKQINLLDDINTDISKSLSSVISIQKGVPELRDTIYGAANLLIHAIDDIWNGREYVDAVDRLSDSIDESIVIQEEQHEELLDQMEEEREEEERRHLDLKESLTALGDTFRELELDKFWDKAVSYSEDFISSYNDIIKYTGASGSEAQEFRRDIVNQVKDMNKELGNKLNSQEVLNTMMSISNSTNISNRETLEAITAPVILAQESMDMHIGEFSKLAGRFYTKYSFSSGSLEGLVDYMRNISKGNDVDENQFVSDLARFENRIVLLAQGNETLVEGMNEELINIRAWADSNYLDGDAFLEDLYNLTSSNIEDRISMSTKYAGIYEELQNLASGGDFGSAGQMMYDYIAGIKSSEVAKAMGISTELWEDIQASSLRGITNIEDFVKDIDESGSARESIEEQFVSLQEQALNKLTEMSSYLATIQEDFGVGISDIALLLSIAGNVKGVLSSAFPLGTMSSSGGLLKGIVGGLGPALGIGAAAAGVALVVSEIRDTMNERRENSGEPYQDALQDEDPGYGYGWKGTFNEDTGKTEWEYSPFKSQEEADNYNPAEALQGYIDDAYESQGWWDKTLDLWEGDFRQGYRSGGGGLLGALRGTLDLLNPFDTMESGLKMDAIDTEGYINKIMSSGNTDLYKFYASKGLLTDYDELKHFSQNIDKYQKYYSEGMYKSGNKWYYTDTDRLVPDSETPNSFAVGANYIPYDQLAYIHKGEAIVPEEYNPAANMNELERLREKNDSREDSEILEVISVLREIKSFMSTWKEDNSRESTLNNTKSMLAAQRNKLAGYEIG